MVMSDIITSSNLSKTCMVIRIIDTKLYVVMSQEKSEQVLECYSKVILVMIISKKLIRFLKKCS